MTSALVIGAGIGGIAAAARLAHLGYQVTVTEKRARPGGRCDRLVKDGHHFDTGPTLFLMPELFIETFADLGECMEDHLDLRRVDPTYHIHFADGTPLVLTSDLNALQAQLDSLEPGSFRGLLRYLDEGGLHYKQAMAHVIGRNFCHPLEFFSLKNLLLILRLKALVNHYDNAGNYFADHRLRIAFTFQDMYMGLSPFEAPATYSLMQYSELVDGVWFPMGGMYRVVEALTAIAQERGALFTYGAPVERIDVRGRRVTGVTLANGEQIRADIVVANADVPYVYRHLLPSNGTARRLERKKYTCSTVTFCWGVDKQYPQLGPHNLFISSDFRRSLDQIFRDLALPDEPSFYVHAPARIDPTLAPPGHDTLMVVIPVGHIDEDSPQDWNALRERARQLVLERFAQHGTADLEEHIKFEASLTPRDWLSRYNLPKGAGWGLSHNLGQLGYLRPHNRHARYRNLYFVGTSTHPGTGVPAVLVSARLTTERILQDAEASGLAP